MQFWSTPDEEKPFEPYRRIGKHVALRPIFQADYSFLQQVQLSDALGFRYRFRGATPSPEQWLQTLWQTVLVQYLVDDLRTGAPVGLVTIYNASPGNGFAYLAAAKFDERDRSPLLMLGVAMFVDLVFTTWSFRKLYLEVPEFNIHRLKTGIGNLISCEGCLREHWYFDGRLWDEYLLAIYRSDWCAVSNRYLRIEGLRARATPKAAPS